MDYVLDSVKNFDLEQIFECGQAFRFTKDESSEVLRYRGVAKGKYLCVRQDGERVVFENTTEEEYKELWEEFFLAFARNASATVHFVQFAGHNTHHILECAFKAFGRALRTAVKVDPEFANEIPSTKGVL